MKTKKQFTNQLTKAGNQIAEFIDQLAAIKKELKRLEKAGLIYGSLHWREGKYCYVIHSSRTSGDGQRRREYIGKDETKIKQKQDAIDRANRYDALSATAHRLESFITRIGYEVDSLLSDIELSDYLLADKLQGAA